MTDLARQLAGTKSPAKAGRLKRSFVAGFYGQVRFVMPRIKRGGLPKALFKHILQRIQERGITQRISPQKIRS